ncbi:unnamed protein product [Caenorhabditis bovis]|uniref:Tetraspanin n=1 Tax=Caenorhabditis bovis TaxID=2654633 RepID=A0A8S1ENC2_9PELO|nr:unnamed protein product [Caenorhabditis bovis]
MGKKSCIYATYIILLVMEVVLLMITAMILSNPFFILIPIEKFDPYIVTYCIVNVIQAILCVITLIGLIRTSTSVLIVCHWISCFTLTVDGAMIFLFSTLMSSAHTGLENHITLLYTENIIEENCGVWEDAYHQLKCCPPSFILNACSHMLNVTKIYCPLDHSNSCNTKLRKWLTDKSGIFGICAYCVIVPLKIFICLALRKDIEEVELEKQNQDYVKEMMNEVNKHGDGYINDFKFSRIDFAETNQRTVVSEYSPFIKKSVIDEVEHEFTVRGEQWRQMLAHTIHSSSTPNF